MTRKELWLRIKTYHFNHIVPANLWAQIAAASGGDASGSKAFAAKIARKHNWTNGRALKAVFEYKKFIYLGVVSDFVVTPSKIIDVVWHEHLLFTKPYREFCDEIIQYSFHHHPELIPMPDQTGQYSAQFLDTLDLYQQEFGVAPPEDIWGVAKFDKDNLIAKNFQSKKKDQHGNNAASYSDAPLITQFDSTATDSKGFPEFTDFGGGDFGGAGAGSGWNGSDSSGSGQSSGDNGSDGGGGCSGGCGGGD